MNKEEYEKLLKSDYWKGYSYSLIKERNFTCEECGRYFPNQRNKLQVHHLVYRDANPWSYQPHELVVLCEDCHKRMHGIHVDPVVDDNPFHKSGDNPLNENPFGDNPFNENPFGGSSLDDNPFTKEGDNPFDDNPFTAPRKNPFDDNTFNKSAERVYTPVDERLVYPEEKKDKSKYILIACLLVIAGYLGYSLLPQSTPDEVAIENPVAEEVEGESPNINDITKHSKSKKTATSTKELSGDDVASNQVSAINESSEEVDIDPVVISEVNNDVSSVSASSSTPAREKTTLEILEERNHADVVKQAKQAGVSTQGTTLEILERINHADVVKQAKQAGVSSEGTTLEILERINHADVVEQAKQAGVSSEGTTLEILERINHADVVKQAKREGVSTEGSTLDILERLNRKSLEKY